MDAALADQKSKMIREKEKAVQMAILQTKHEEEQKRDKLAETYEQKLDNLRGEIKERLNVIVELNSRICSFQHETNELKLFIDELRSEFQKFFEQFINMKSGEADFLFLKKYIISK